MLSRHDLSKLSSEHFYVAEPDIFIFLLRRLAGFLK